MLSRGIRFAALAAITLTVAGCGSTIDGTAAAGELDVRELEVGKYATDPLDLRYTYYHDLSGGANLALMRLADQVVTGPEIDARLKYGTGAVPILDAEKATKTLADVTQPVLESNGMMFGYAVGHRDTPADKSGKRPEDASFTTVTVLQFPSEEAAKKAAMEIEELDFELAADANQPVQLSKYADAHTHWRPGVPTIGSVMARSNYVINVYAGLKDPELDKLTELVEQVYDAQAPLLDALKPLNREDMLRLKYDTDGMLRRTLNPDGFGSPDISSQAAFELRGFLHQVSDQDHWSRVMRDVGMDRYSLSRSMSNSSMVFRTRDTEAAENLITVILENSYPNAADAPAAIPNARCGESPTKDDYSTKRFRCAVTYRQYVATVEGDQLTDAHQRAAAQYALLTNSW
ncbi:hypothetical protein HLB23_19055 [Nocardia uniformis]|uniref:Uncharacterized protein n=1 Tax=Nocardia uniformis TaxID=53432 RepID=A0A849C685_9NOCA|nr:hypothetical protein [Nocardia uniformis]NNH71930.1 hypothetical protein [Nocardia uniformis]